jgi:hypothetical protein
MFECEVSGGRAFPFNPTAQVTQIALALFHLHVIFRQYLFVSAFSHKRRLSQYSASIPTSTDMNPTTDATTNLPPVKQEMADTITAAVAEKFQASMGDVAKNITASLTEGLRAAKGEIVQDVAASVAAGLQTSINDMAASVRRDIQTAQNDIVKDVTGDVQTSINDAIDALGRSSDPSCTPSEKSFVLTW